VLLLYSTTIFVHNCQLTNSTKASRQLFNY